MDDAELADFLRTRRERLRPKDVGLREGARRRTPGLRREEVAALAEMSTDYYTRLEQGRGPNPSPAILGSLARALRLTDDERDHLFHLAGQLPPARAARRHVSPGLLHVLDRLSDTPAFVVSDLGEVVVQNPLARTLFGASHGRGEGRGSNALWHFFTDEAARSVFPRESWPRHARAHVSALRTTYGRRRGDADVESLVADLLAASEEFAQLWAAHDVGPRRMDEKVVLHPEVGELDLLCETLTSDVSGQTLVVLHPRPGSGADEQLALLRVIGTQDLTPSGSA